MSTKLKRKKISNDGNMNKKAKSNEKPLHILCKEDGLEISTIQKCLDKNIDLASVNDFGYGYIHIIAEHQKNALKLIEYISKKKKGEAVSEIACTPVGNRTVLDCYMKNKHFSLITYRDLLELFVKEKKIDSVEGLRDYFGLKTIEDFLFEQHPSLDDFKGILECTKMLFHEENSLVLNNDELKALILHYIKTKDFNNSILFYLLSTIQPNLFHLDFCVALIYLYVSNHSTMSIDVVDQFLLLAKGSQKKLILQQSHKFLYATMSFCFSNPVWIPYFLRIVNCGVESIKNSISGNSVFTVISKDALLYFITDQHHYFDFPNIVYTNLFTHEINSILASRRHTKTCWTPLLFPYYSVEVQASVFTFLKVLAVLFRDKKTNKNVPYIPRPLVDLILSYALNISAAPVINIYSELNSHQRDI